MDDTSSLNEGEAALSPEDEGRASTYGLLGVLLAKPPTREVLDRLNVEDSEWKEGSEDRPMAVAWRTLAMASQRATLEGLDDEYHDLFIGVGRGELMPYASWYLTGFLMERPLAELRRDLSLLGFERRERVSEPEDHAAALLETMSLMIIAADVSDQQQRRFFNRHIEPWMGRFFEDLEQAERANFYSAVGVLGKRFVEIDKQYLAMLPH